MKMAKTNPPTFHVLHRSGYVGTEKPLTTGEFTAMRNSDDYHMVPGVNAGPDCPANGDCSICPISDKCVKLNELRTYEETAGILLPAQFHGNSKPKAGKAGAWGDDMLLPAGVE
jgi:hypothetical protein